MLIPIYCIKKRLDSRWSERYVVGDEYTYDTLSKEIKMLNGGFVMTGCYEIEMRELWSFDPPNNLLAKLKSL